MPEVEDIADGSQDMLLGQSVRRRLVAGGENARRRRWFPLPAWFARCPTACAGRCLDSVCGERIESGDDIARISAGRVRANSLDLLQVAAHIVGDRDRLCGTCSARLRRQPVYQLLGYERWAEPKEAYASALFGDLSLRSQGEKAQKLRADGLKRQSSDGAVRPVQREADAEQVQAAREGLGDDAELLVDAGTVWVDDVESAAQRLPALQEARVLWLEEPFVSGALDAYKELAQRCRGSVRLAGGEGAHDRYMAFHLMEHGGIGYVQIDAGRVGGISEARHVVERRRTRWACNTSTTLLRRSSRSQPRSSLLPVRRTIGCASTRRSFPLARDLTRTAIAVDADGRVTPPHDVGLGLELDLDAVRPYLLDVEIKVAGRALYRTPELVP